MLKLNKTLALLTVAAFGLLSQSCEKILDPNDDIIIDPTPIDTVETAAGVEYNGLVSEMELDLNMSRDIDIWTEYEQFPAMTTNRAEAYKIVTNGNFKLLAYAPNENEDDFFMPRPSLVALNKGDEIYRGEEEVAYEKDYWYGNEYYFIYANYNLMTDDIKYWSNDFVENNVGAKYIALIEERNGNWHFGWIELSLEQEIVMTGGIPDKPGMIFGDAYVKITDSYISPEPGQGVKAGFKN